DDGHRQGETARQRFADYAQKEDARFDVMMKSESPEQIRRMSDQVLAYAAELGVEREQLLQLLKTEPIMRNAAFQKMMYDAAAYRMMKNAAKEVGARPAPAVQRPGAAQDPRVVRAEAAMRATNRKFSDRPTLKNAADILVAQ